MGVAVSQRGMRCNLSFEEALIPRRQSLLVVAAALLLGAVSARAQTPPVDISITQNVLPRDDVAKAVDVFKRACSPLNQYWADIKSIGVEVAPEVAEYRLEKGWNANIHITVKVPDDPRVIPKFDRRTGVIAGHTLHYDIGGGRDPGMFGGKRVSQMLCGMPISDRGADTFVRLPELSFLQYGPRTIPQIPACKPGDWGC